MKGTRRIILPSIFLSTLLPGCAQSIKRMEVQADVKAIRTLINDFSAAHRFNDGSRLAAFYTDDAVLMPEGEPIVRGKEAIAARYQQDMNDNYVELVCIPEEIEVSGDMAFLRGIFTVKITPKERGNTVELTFKAVSLLRRRPEGSWALYCDIWNSDAPLAPKGQTLAPPHEFELRATNNPTHVSEGMYRVGWIRTSLPSDESRAQIIPVEMHEPYVYWPQGGLKKQDVNFDGHLDIGVCQHGGAKWGRFYWYLYDPEKMEFYTNALTKELSELTCATFKADSETKRITITQFLGADLREYSYQIVDGHLSSCGSRKLDEGSRANQVKSVVNRA